MGRSPASTGSRMCFTRHARGWNGESQGRTRASIGRCSLAALGAFLPRTCRAVRESEELSRWVVSTRERWRLVAREARGSMLLSVRRWIQTCPASLS